MHPTVGSLLIAHIAKVEKKFTGLITRKTEQDLDAFLQQEHTFKEQG